MRIQRSLSVDGSLGEALQLCLTKRCSHYSGNLRVSEHRVGVWGVGPCRSGTSDTMFDELLFLQATLSGVFRFAV